MKFLILGAGGIGAYYGARLIEAGHEVVMTARGPHLAALQDRGLTVRLETGEHHWPVTALATASLPSGYAADDFDLIVLALKGTATAPVLAELADWLRRGTTPVLSLQNGVDNEPLLAEQFGEQRVIGGLAVRIGAHIVSPGVIESEGAAEIIMGQWPTAASLNQGVRDLLARLEGLFNEAGIPARVTADIRYELWRKLVINNGVNPLSALTGLDTRSLTHHPDFGPIVHGLMQETVSASAADGVDLNARDLEEMFELIRSFNAIKTSMLVDREKGRPLELDSICGAVLRRCRALGVPAPYTELVNALLAHQSAR